MTETPHTPLEPCPFCGGEAMLAKKYVWCKRCGAEGSVAEPISKAIQAWNTRAIPLPTTANNPETDAHRDLVEALRGLLHSYKETKLRGGFELWQIESWAVVQNARSALTKAEVTHG